MAEVMVEVLVVSTVVMVEATAADMKVATAVGKEEDMEVDMEVDKAEDMVVATPAVIEKNMEVVTEDNTVVVTEVAINSHHHLNTVTTNIRLKEVHHLLNSRNLTATRHRHSHLLRVWIPMVILLSRDTVELIALALPRRQRRSSSAMVRQRAIPSSTPIVPGSARLC